MNSKEDYKYAQNVELHDQPKEPQHWPSQDVKYTCKLLWDDVSPNVKAIYEDELDILSLYVDVISKDELNERKRKINSDEQEMAEETQQVETSSTEKDEDLCVSSKQTLRTDAWLCEITGNVIKESQLRRFRLLHHPEQAICPAFFFYQNDKKERYYIEPQSKELLYMKRLKDKLNTQNEEANLKIHRVWIDGFLRLFLEITRDIEEHDELVIGYDDDEEAQLLLDSNLIDNLPIIDFIPSEEEENTKDSSNNNNSNNNNSNNHNSHDFGYSLKMLPESDQTFFSTHQNLSHITEIRVITEENHPCIGQFGLFSLKNFGEHVTIGEYTGLVVQHITDDEGKPLASRERLYESKYLVDFSNPFGGVDGEPITETWIDADQYGNEVRFMNDHSGTGKEANVMFKRAWIGGKMHVIAQTTRAIQKGDEFLVEYGERYWSSMVTDEVVEGEEEEEQEEMNVEDGE